MLNGEKYPIDAAASSHRLQQEQMRAAPSIRSRTGYGAVFMIMIS